MRRADRLFELIHLLRRARRAITAAQLAETLEVAPRTIYRDIAALMAMGVPIDGAAGVGYIMRPGYDLPPLMFDREEVEAVAVGLQLLTRTGDQDLQVAARRVAAKIAAVLPELRADELDDGRFVVSGFGAPTASSPAVRRATASPTWPRSCDETGVSDGACLVRVRTEDSALASHPPASSACRQRLFRFRAHRSQVDYRSPMTRASSGTACPRASSETPA